MCVHMALVLPVVDEVFRCFNKVKLQMTHHENTEEQVKVNLLDLLSV